MIKLIATDMDGTWLNSKKTYDMDKFRKIIDLCNEKNIKFVVASGNQYENLLARFPKEYIPQMYFVAENGAYVLHGHEPLNIVGLSPHEIEEIKQIEKECPGPRVWSGEKSAYTLKEFGQDYCDVLDIYFAKVKILNNFDEIDDKYLFKLTRSLDWGEAPGLAKKLQAEYPDLGIVAGSTRAVDISKPGMSKAYGLEFLGKKFGIKPNEMLSFGDGGNDMAMLKYTGMSFAPNTAIPEVQEAAKGVIGSSEESSVQNKIIELIA